MRICPPESDRLYEDPEAVRLIQELDKLFREQPSEVTLPVLAVALMATICGSADPVKTVDQVTRFMRAETRRLQPTLGRAQTTEVH